MRLASTFTLLACSALVACRAPPSTTNAGSTVTSTTGAGDGDASSDGGAAVADPLAIFLEAAQTNLERPYPASRPGAERFYYEAGLALDGGVTPSLPAAWNVAMTLALDDDPRAPRALVAWAAAPGARPYLTYIVQGMTSRPREMYLDTVKAILGDPALAGELNHAMAIGPSFGGAIGRVAQVSLFAQALDLAAALPGEGGRDLVRQVAADHARDAPDPRTMAALRCEKGEVRVEGEARALASVRLMALAALGDRALWARIADDPSETPFIRGWVRRMVRGRKGRMMGESSDDVAPCRSVPPKAGDAAR